MTRTGWVVLLIAGLAAVSGCPAARDRAGPSTSAPATPSPASPASPVPVPRDCPVTLPAPVTPSGAAPGEMFGQDSGYGNGSLWVGGLGDNGVIVGDARFVDGNGMVGMKFGWWRGVPGRLRITGRRLDGPAPPAIPSVPDGYGEFGFQATGVTFPVPGCWEITGTVASASLTFVTFVVKTA